MEIKEAINHLKTYIDIDIVYQNYKNTPNAEKSDFEKFCIDHCEAIEVLINEYERLKEVE